MQDRLTSQEDQQERVTDQGRAAVDEFTGECSDHHLPPLPWISD
ncbi:MULTISPECIES: hypothetical protein [unclassified Kitasatospora]